MLPHSLQLISRLLPPGISHIGVMRCADTRLARINRTKDKNLRCQPALHITLMTLVARGSRLAFMLGQFLLSMHLGLVRVVRVLDGTVGDVSGGLEAGEGGYGRSVAAHDVLLVSHCVGLGVLGIGSMCVC